MTWLFEEPLIIVLTGGAFVFLLSVAWVQTGRNLFLGIVGGVITLTAGMLAWERMVITDSEAVRAKVYSIASEVERNEVDRLVTQFVQSRPEYAQRIRTELPKYKFTEARVTKVHRVESQPKHQPPQVVIEFNVSVSGTFDSGTLPNQTFQRWVQVTFWKEDDGEWRVADYEHSEPTRFMKKRDL